jgi:hypothetical protein
VTHPEGETLPVEGFTETAWGWERALQDSDWTVCVEREKTFGRGPWVVTVDSEDENRAVSGPEEAGHLAAAITDALRVRDWANTRWPG